MKRFLFPLFVLILVTAVPAFAQDNNNLITLNDATPAIDVVINLPPDTTGAIALDFSGAAVQLTDASQNVVFKAADARLHGLELNIAPNSNAHTLTVSRLPRVAEAVVRVTSLPELTQTGTTELVSGQTLTLSQEVSLPLSADHPGDTVNVSIPAASIGVLNATFPGAGATSQVVDNMGVVVAESVAGHVDGLNLVLDAGEYRVTLLGSNLTQPVVAGVRAVSVTDTSFTVVQAPTSSAPVTTAALPDCTAVVAVSSTNLRSGPGTGYSVLGYGYRDQSFLVGGHNPEDNWVVVGTAAGSAWVSRGNIQTQGNCADLTVFNVPLHDAQPAPIVITASGPFSSFGGGDDHEDDDHEEHENEDHDDDD